MLQAIRTEAYGKAEAVLSKTVQDTTPVAEIFKNDFSGSNVKLANIRTYEYDGSGNIAKQIDWDLRRDKKTVLRWKYEYY